MRRWMRSLGMPLGLQDLFLREHLVEVQLRAVLREQLARSVEVFHRRRVVTTQFSDLREALMTSTGMEAEAHVRP